MQIQGRPAVPRPRDVGLLQIFWPILLISSSAVFVGAMLVATDGLAGFYVDNYIDLVFDTPGFDYRLGVDGTESGNAVFGVYVQLRLLASAALLCVVVTGVVLRVLEACNPEAGVQSSRMVSAMISKPLALIILLLVFPAVWDMTTGIVDGASLWIVNPMYSWDDKRPCPAEWYDRPHLIIDRYNDSKYTRGYITYTDPGLYDPAPHMRQAEDVCRPDLRTNYLISQAVRGTEYDRYRTDDLFMHILVTDFGSEMLTNSFFAVAKAVVAINVIIMTMISLILTDVIAGVVIATLPVFASLTMVPRFSKISAIFLNAVPGLVMIPVLSAVLTVVGSSFVAGIPVHVAGDADLGLLYTWMAAVGVLLLISMTPVMVVFFIGSLTGQVSGIIPQAVMTVTFVTGMASGIRANISRTGTAGHGKNNGGDGGGVGIRSP